MKIAVTMRTFDRQQGFMDHMAPDAKRANYLGSSLENMRRGGVFDSSLLSSFTLVDSGSKHLEGFLLHELRKLAQPVWNIKLDKTEVPRTANENAARALAVGAADLDAQWVLFCEDDLDVCSDFLWSVGNWLRKHESEKYRLYTFGSAAVDPGDGDKRASVPVSLPCFYGTVCYAIRREDAASMAEYIGGHPRYTGGRFYGTGDPGVTVAHDLHFHQFHEQLYPKVTHVLASAPSFVQHIGDQSGISTRSHLITYKSWPGREWTYRG